MVLEFIGFILGILMLVNGVMGNIMVLVFKLALMGAAMLGSLNVGLNMALVATISEMAIGTLGSISGTKSTDLVCTTLLTGTVTRVRGTKAVNKATGCTPSETGRGNVVNGMVVHLKFHCPH